MTSRAIPIRPRKDCLDIESKGSGASGRGGWWPGRCPAACALTAWRLPLPVVVALPSPALAPTPVAPRSARRRQARHILTLSGSSHAQSPSYDGTPNMTHTYGTWTARSATCHTRQHSVKRTPPPAVRPPAPTAAARRHRSFSAKRVMPPPVVRRGAVVWQRLPRPAGRPGPCGSSGTVRKNGFGGVSVHGGVPRTARIRHRALTVRTRAAPGRLLRAAPEGFRPLFRLPVGVPSKVMRRRVNHQAGASVLRDGQRLRPLTARTAQTG